MKRIATLVLLAVFAASAATPASAKKENKSIGENGHEAKRAAKQQRKSVNKNAKRQRKAAKRAQKAQRRAAKHHGK